MKTTSTPRPTQFLLSAFSSLQGGCAPRALFALWAALSLTSAGVASLPASAIAGGPAQQAVHVEYGNHPGAATGRTASSRTSSALSPDGVHISSGPVGQDGKPEDWGTHQWNRVAYRSYPVSADGKPEDWTTLQDQQTLDIETLLGPFLVLTWLRLL